jgi:carbon monoxide dehydrogenase subunit G
MMKISGSYTFQASRDTVFAALLDPQVLKASIPGCEDAWYSAEHGHMKVRIVTPVPGLEGPYDITVTVLLAPPEAPACLVLQVGRAGRIGGKIATVTQIMLNDENGGSFLTYETTAELEGPVAAANNPVFQGIARQSLKTLFKKLDTSLVSTGV